MLTIKFKMVTEDHINEAVDLVTNAYYEEMKVIPYLPEEDYSKIFSRL